LLNPTLFIAQRLGHTQKPSFSATVSQIGMGSVALGLAAMIISFAVLRGYQHAVRDKILSLSGHFVVESFDVSNAYEKAPLSTQTLLFQHYKEYVPQIADLQPVSLKPGLLKTDEELMGVVFKGIGPQYPQSRFKSALTSGDLLEFPKDSAFSPQVLLSQRIADQLRLKVGDPLLIYFIQNPPKVRKLKVKGIYTTYMQEFDNALIIGDLNLIRQVNRWPDTLTGSYEIFLKNFQDLPQAAQRLDEVRAMDMSVTSVTERYIGIFDWLNLLNRNVFIFLALILLWQLST
jgi:lipoprotein-releasing system permease protein